MTHPFQPLAARLDPELLSIVVPVYNEEKVLPELRWQLGRLLETLPCPAEVIIVNDGSSDRSLLHLLAWAQEDRRVKVLGLARNFGQQAALTAGLDFACGDAVVIMDADLQDPPEVIVQMLRQYRQGYDVVYGQRVGRAGEGVFKRFTAWAFYRCMRWLIHADLPEDTGD